MKTYDEIKAELLEIAEVLKKYPDNIQPQVFEILTTHFLGGERPKPIVKTPEETNTSSDTPLGNKRGKSKPNGKATVKSKDPVTLLKDLNLRASGKKSFKDFYDEKKPSTAAEFNTVALYYLEDILQLTNISPSHIYTCYKEVTKRPPEAFIQSLRDTASRNGYIDTADTNNLKLPLRGRNFVEHDLPREKAKK